MFPHLPHLHINCWPSRVLWFLFHDYKMGVQPTHRDLLFEDLPWNTKTMTFPPGLCMGQCGQWGCLSGTGVFGTWLSSGKLLWKRDFLSTTPRIFTLTPISLLVSPRSSRGFVEGPWCLWSDASPWRHHNQDGSYTAVTRAWSPSRVEVVFLRSLQAGVMFHEQWTSALCSCWWSQAGQGATLGYTW